LRRQHGLATTAQLEAFRDKFGALATTKTIWMSATLRQDWLEAIDFKDKVSKLLCLELGDDDRRFEELNHRYKQPSDGSKRKLLLQTMKQKSDD